MCCRIACNLPQSTLIYLNLGWSRFCNREIWSMGFVLAKSLPSDARVISKPTWSQQPRSGKTSLQDNPLGNSEVKTKAELGSLKPSEMIPDFDGNLPDDATDSNWNGKCMSVWKEGTPEGTKMTWTNFVLQVDSDGLLYCTTTRITELMAHEGEINRSPPPHAECFSRNMCSIYSEYYYRTRKHQEYLTSGIFLIWQVNQTFFSEGSAKHLVILLGMRVLLQKHKNKNI